MTTLKTLEAAQIEKRGIGPFVSFDTSRRCVRCFGPWPHHYNTRCFDVHPAGPDVRGDFVVEGG